MSGLKRITFRLPGGSPEADEFFDSLTSLLLQDPNSHLEAGELSISPGYPPGALPVTALALARESTPQVIFEMERPLQRKVGNLELYSTSSGPAADGSLAASAQQNQANCLPPRELAHRFLGGIRRLDHSGVELPATLIDRPAWEALLHTLGSASNLYRYPTGQEWPFLLPATRDEFQDEIKDFAAARGPKFELTYGYTELPTLQFHADTGLSKAAVESLLPPPVGFTLPGVETFRSVYLAHPWPGIAIRFDLTFWSGEALNDWDSGEWLASRGIRVQA